MVARLAVLAGALALSVSAALAGEVAPQDVNIVDGELARSLTGGKGDPAAGRKTFSNRKLGNCLACHANKDMDEHLFHGEVGPPLDGVGERWEEAQLRAIIVDSKAVFGPETVMPGFYSLDVGANVRKDLIGKTILSAEHVEDIVAYLLTLK